MHGEGYHFCVTAERVNGMGGQFDEQIERDNARILRLLSRYLTENPAFIGADMVAELKALGLDGEDAFSLLLASALGLDVEGDAGDKAFYHAYFPKMVHRQDAAAFADNPYCRAVSFYEKRVGGCTLKYERYRPYEAFVCDDIETLPDGRRVPQIGYFDCAFSYPAIFENGRLWMSVTPNEVNTMAEPVGEASGRVLTFGLGLAYFAYMAARKESVSSVTVVEQNPDVIRLFERELARQLDCRNKIRIVQGDAFEYAESHFGKGEYDFIFTDLWHDVSDGLPLYQRMKALEKPASKAVHRYWIEKTLRCYL